jgi:hypothetical protein
LSVIGRNADRRDPTLEKNYRNNQRRATEIEEKRIEHFVAPREHVKKKQKHKSMANDIMQI